MDFSFSPEQLALRDVARDLFSKESPPSRIRDLWEGADPGREVWRRIAEVGIAGLTTADSGGDLVDLALVCEEAGRAALPEPLVETVAVVAPAVPSDIASRIADGEIMATAAIGRTHFAPWAADADVVLTEAGGELHLLDRFETQSAGSVDPARRLGSVRGNGTRIGGTREAKQAWLRGAAATAGVLNGIALRLLDTTVAYVSDRVQFGRPVGSFQAVKHKLASVHVLVECSRTAAWYASYALASGDPDAPTAVSVAKAYANDAAACASAEALQCHAGVGFTWEHDLHIWLKRGKALESPYGTAREHRARLELVVFGDG